MKTKEKVLLLLSSKGPLSVNDIVGQLKISRQYVHRLLLEIEEAGLIKKLGSSPHVFYSAIEAKEKSNDSQISHDDEQFLAKYFFLVDALGNPLSGLEAMKYWCERQNLPLNKTIKEFTETREKYLGYYNVDGLINGTSKLVNTKGIGEIGVDNLFYLDFYAIERFGKTRLGALMHYAKQGQNKKLMKVIADEIRQRIINTINSEKIDAVLFVPPSISRKTQIMDMLKSYLKIDLPEVSITKIKTPIVVPQKALSKLFERVENARNTFLVRDKNKFKHVLIIDDAVGSGATMNEIALKIKKNNVSQKVTGIAVCGSFKGFDVISEL